MPTLSILYVEDNDDLRATVSELIESEGREIVALADAEGFGACTNTGACSAECPKEISLENIAHMNREYLGSKITSTRM